MGILKQTCVFLAALNWSSAVIAGNCLPPVSPWFPANSDDVRAYADLLKRDAETYFADVEQYFRCLDQQRREVFEQAREVSEDYVRVLELLEDVRS